MRILRLACALAALTAAREAPAMETGPDCSALIVSAAFVSAQFHAVRGNPERSDFATAPALALQNANWARKMSTVFEALGKQARSDDGRSAFSSAGASMSMLASEPVEGPAAGNPKLACSIAPNPGPKLLSRQLNSLSRLEQRLRDAWSRACR